jgi:hypothetical protein
MVRMLPVLLRGALEVWDGAAWGPAGASVEYVVVAGGGGGGSYRAGGGGAGGYRSSVEGESSGGTATALLPFVLRPQTFTITVGAGGTGGTSGGNGTKGSNSVFGLCTSEGGGFGSGTTAAANGGAGGSGGGGHVLQTGGTGDWVEVIDETI